MLLGHRIDSRRVTEGEEYFFFHCVWGQGLNRRINILLKKYRVYYQKIMCAQKSAVASGCSKIRDNKVYKVHTPHTHTHTHIYIYTHTHTCLKDIFL